MLMPTIYLTPRNPLPTERHIAVVVRRDKIGGEKGYFYDSGERGLWVLGSV
jgi:hypothetical protein